MEDAKCGNPVGSSEYLMVSCDKPKGHKEPCLPLSSGNAVTPYDKALRELAERIAEGVLRCHTFHEIPVAIEAILRTSIVFKVHTDSRVSEHTKLEATWKK